MYIYNEINQKMCMFKLSILWNTPEVGTDHSIYFVESSYAGGNNRPELLDFLFS